MPLRHVPTPRRTLGLLFAFGCCIVAMGHGIAPLGLFMVFGVAEWPVLALLSWVPPLLLLVAHRIENRALYALGLAGLGATWGVAYRYVDVRWMLVLTSTPFLFLLAVQLRDLVLGVPDEDAASRRSRA